MNRMRYDEIEGKELVTADGDEIGSVRGIELDVAEWRVNNLVVRLHRDQLDKLKLRRPFIGSQDVLIGAHHVQSVGDVVLLGQPHARLAELAEVPEGAQRAEAPEAHAEPSGTEPPQGEPPRAEASADEPRR